MNTKINFYLCHPRTTREEVREWEIGFEIRTGINLINPFYDTDNADTEMNELGKEKYDDIKDPSIIVESDLAMIEKPNVKGLVVLIDTIESWGSPMEMVYAKIIYKKEVYSVITNGDHNHPWLRYHSDKVFLDRDSLEKYLIKKKKNDEMIRRVLSREPRTIKSKAECYALYESGFFGNKPLTWDSYEGIISSGFNSDVVIRSKKGMFRNKVRYKVPLKKVPEKIKQLEENGIFVEDLAFNEAMPDECISIQGEVARSFVGLDLYYSTLKEPMNIALQKQPQEARGLKAKMLLQSNMSSQSYSKIEGLLDMFPNDIIEFSSWGRSVGVEETDTIVWEVRNF